MPRAIGQDGIIYSSRVKSLAELRNDDDAAAAEAEAQRGVPGYCGKNLMAMYANVNKP